MPYEAIGCFAERLLISDLPGQPTTSKFISLVPDGVAHSEMLFKGKNLRLSQRIPLVAGFDNRLQSTEANHVVLPVKNVDHFLCRVWASSESWSSPSLQTAEWICFKGLQLGPPDGKHNAFLTRQGVFQLSLNMLFMDDLSPLFDKAISSFFLAHRLSFFPFILFLLTSLRAIFLHKALVPYPFCIRHCMAFISKHEGLGAHAGHYFHCCFLI